MLLLLLVASLAANLMPSDLLDRIQCMQLHGPLSCPLTLLLAVVAERAQANMTLRLRRSSSVPSCGRRTQGPPCLEHQGFLLR